MHVAAPVFVFQATVAQVPAVHLERPSSEGTPKQTGWVALHGKFAMLPYMMVSRKLAP